MVSLGEEINVYEYEDDEWLDETDSDYEEEEQPPEPSPEPSPVPVAQPEGPSTPQEAAKPLPQPDYNRQAEWRTEKTSHYQAVQFVDKSKDYKYMRISYSVEATDKTSGFSAQTRKMSMDWRQRQQVAANKGPMPAAPVKRFQAEKGMQIEVQPAPVSLSLSRHGRP